MLFRGNRSTLPIVFGLFALPTCVFAGVTTYSDLHSLSYSEPVPIYEAVKDWENGYKGGTLAFTYNQLEVGVAVDDFRIGYLARYDYRLAFSEDTARFYFEQENDLKPEASKSYTMEIDALHQRSQGLALHYDWQPRDGLKVSPSMTLLYANAIIDGNLSGQAGFLGDDTYDGQLSVDYYYLDDFLFERELERNDYRGLGYAIDLQVDWRPVDHWQFRFKSRDLFARIHWDDLPRTVAVANTTPVQTDDPFERYKNGAVQGQESNQSFKQKLPARFDLSSRYRYQDFSLIADLYYDPERSFFFPSVAYHAGNLELALVAEPFVQAMGVRITHPWLSFSLISDSLDYQKAHFLSLGLSINIPIR